jgi:hypothetical protein
VPKRRAHSGLGNIATASAGASSLSVIIDWSFDLSSALTHHALCAMAALKASGP